MISRNSRTIRRNPGGKSPNEGAKTSSATTITTINMTMMNTDTHAAGNIGHMPDSGEVK